MSLPEHTKDHCGAEKEPLPPSAEKPEPNRRDEMTVSRRGLFGLLAGAAVAPMPPLIWASDLSWAAGLPRPLVTLPQVTRVVAKPRLLVQRYTQLPLMWVDGRKGTPL